MNQVEERFKTGLKKHRTPLDFDYPCDDDRMTDLLVGAGAHIEYSQERSVHFFYKGHRMFIGHNWMDERYVSSSISIGGREQQQEYETEIQMLFE